MHLNWKKLYDRRELYAMNSVPQGVLLLTARVDVQKVDLHGVSRMV